MTQKAQLDSVDAKAAHVIMAHGRAPNLLRNMDDQERADLAALVDDAGNLLEGAGERFRLLLISHFKGAEDEAPPTEPISVQPQFRAPRAVEELRAAEREAEMEPEKPRRRSKRAESEAEQEST
jgi:hypothetical protein